MLKINVDYHYQYNVTFEDASEVQDDRGYYFKPAEEQKYCYRYTFDNVDDFLDFFGNDFEDSINDLHKNFVAVVITVEK